jgi:peptidoglycan/xylan/chitin deacetylase (PgdA/CDA1 family)
MRLSTLLILALLVARADARRGPRQTKPTVVAIAKTVASAPVPTPAEVAAETPAETAPPTLDASKYTKDPILAGADRVIGRDHPGFVAFTFDDGPNPTYTPTVIAALQKYDVPATFFIITRAITTAKRAEQSKQLLAKELELGYTIGDHTAHHANLQQVPEESLESEVDRSIITLSKVANRPIGLFRAPYGRLNDRSRARLTQLGVTDVYWSIDSRDWELDAATLRKQLLRTIKDENGGVVLMHDTHKITAEVIHEVLDDLEAENCRRLKMNETPIWPVSVHYFLQDNGTARAIPDDVAKRTAAYQRAMPDRCALRAVAAGEKPVLR